MNKQTETLDLIINNVNNHNSKFTACNDIDAEELQIFKSPVSGKVMIGVGSHFESESQWWLKFSIDADGTIEIQDQTAESDSSSPESKIAELTKIF